VRRGAFNRGAKGAAALMALCLAVPGAARAGDAMVLECEVLRWDYHYAPGSGAAVNEEMVSETLRLDLEAGTYAHLDDAGDPGEVRDIHSVTDTVIVLADYARSERGIARDELSARIDRRDWSYTYVRDLRRDDGLEEITTGEGACEPHMQSPEE